MSRCFLFTLLLLSVLGVTSAASVLGVSSVVVQSPVCAEIQRRCGSSARVVCGMISCIVTYRCCKGHDQENSSECFSVDIEQDVQLDVPLRCENGGTKLPASLAVRESCIKINNPKWLQTFSKEV